MAITRTPKEVFRATRRFFSELALLERERKLLEERKKIRDLRAELGADGG